LIDLGRWTAPPVFAWLQRAGIIEATEMLRTFNCGIGVVLVAAQRDADPVLDALRAAGMASTVIGEVVTGGGPDQVRTTAKGKGDAEGVRLSGALRFAE
jgi:phosphoribosylformylglycinamidine cyclo-ligase